MKAACTLKESVPHTGGLDRKRILVNIMALTCVKSEYFNYKSVYSIVIVLVGYSALPSGLRWYSLAVWSGFMLTAWICCRNLNQIFATVPE